MTDDFWKRKSLAEMTQAEWESLCDGCGLCCLQKLENEETGEIYFTDIACKLLDTDTCRCSDYSARLNIVKDCLVLSVEEPETFKWLPGTCAYRLIAEGANLPEWHPLVSGDAESVHEAGVSAKGKCVSETESEQWTVLRRLS